MRVDWFDSVAKVGTHYEITGPETWDQTGQNPNAFVYATDTDATLACVGKFLIGITLE